MLHKSTLIAVVAACGSSHHYGTLATNDPHKLYVEITTEGRRDDALRASAEAGLSSIRFAVPVDHGGDVELQVELSGLDKVGNETVCQMKILVLRGTGHDLLGIADGTARAKGTHDKAGDDCVESLGASLIRGKVQVLLRRQLDDKR